MVTRLLARSPSESAAAPKETIMEEKAVSILDARRIMTVATVRPDGWPQTTIVGYANDGLTIYFLIERTSQKFSNIERDNRISVAIGEEPRDLRHVRAVYAAARAIEITDQAQRELAWRLLMQRHPNLRDYELPDASLAAMMRADCQHVSALDFILGQRPGGTSTLEPSRADAWGGEPASAV